MSNYVAVDRELVALLKRCFNRLRPPNKYFYSQIRFRVVDRKPLDNTLVVFRVNATAPTTSSDLVYPLPGRMSVEVIFEEHRAVTLQCRVGENDHVVRHFFSHGEEKKMCMAMVWNAARFFMDERAEAVEYPGTTGPE